MLGSYKRYFFAKRSRYDLATLRSVAADAEATTDATPRKRFPSARYTRR